MMGAPRDHLSPADSAGAVGLGGMGVGAVVDVDCAAPIPAVEMRLYPAGAKPDEGVEPPSSFFGSDCPLFQPIWV
jgi:hypothetical protein